IATSLLAIAGNCIFLWTMRNSPRIHSPSNLFLANLALSDLMVGAIVQPLFTAYKVAELLQEYTCDVHIAFSFCAWTSVGVSFLTLVSVSAERYFTIFKSFENPIALREGHVYVLCTCIWTFAVLFMFLSHTTRNSAHKQTHSADDHTLQSKARSKPCHPLDTPKNKDTNNLSEKPAFYRRVVGIQSNKSVKTVALVTGLFFLCYLPTLAIMLAYITHGYSSLIKTLYSITDTVVFMNSCFNPVIYYYKNQEIRQAVKKIFCIRHKINSGL
ncbi:predicted protein, partial [Nematostella vectensis]